MTLIFFLLPIISCSSAGVVTEAVERVLDCLQDSTMTVEELQARADQLKLQLMLHNPESQSERSEIAWEKAFADYDEASSTWALATAQAVVADEPLRDQIARRQYLNRAKTFLIGSAACLGSMAALAYTRSIGDDKSEALQAAFSKYRYTPIRAIEQLVNSLGYYRHLVSLMLRPLVGFEAATKSFDRLPTIYRELQVAMKARDDCFMAVIESVGGSIDSSAVTKAIKNGATLYAMVVRYLPQATVASLCAFRKRRDALRVSLDDAWDEYFAQILPEYPMRSSKGVVDEVEDRCERIVELSAQRQSVFFDIQATVRQGFKEKLDALKDGDGKKIPLPILWFALRPCDVLNDQIRAELFKLQKDVIQLTGPFISKMMLPDHFIPQLKLLLNDFTETQDAMESLNAVPLKYRDASGTAPRKSVTLQAMNGEIYFKRKIAQFQLEAQLVENTKAIVAHFSSVVE